MHLIPPSHRLGINSENPRPQGVRAVCPYCAETVVFSHFHWRPAPGLKHVEASRSACAGCTAAVTFVVIHTAKSPPAADVFMYPAPRPQREAVPAISKLMADRDPRLARAYSSAVAAYANGDWNATASHCGRVLEGVVRSIVPDAPNARLAHLLQELPRHLDLRKPIVQLADAIREGRNIGAHFDQVIETDEPTAGELLDLLEYLTEFLFILPARINDTRERLTGSSESPDRR
jgi:hypothetical protein